MRAQKTFAPSCTPKSPKRVRNVLSDTHDAQAVERDGAGNPAFENHAATLAAPGNLLLDQIGGGTDRVDRGMPRLDRLARGAGGLG